MSEEQTTQTTSTEQSSSTEAPQSLDQVYKQFNVEEAAQTFQPKQAQTQQLQTQTQQKTEVAVPDPVLDSEGFKKWQGNQSQNLQQALSSVQGELTAIRVERLRSKEEADIKSAVQRFKSVAGDDVDEDVAEIALGQRARKDPKFLTVYQNRDKNPVAWNAAVSALANEFKTKNQFRIDPTIAENQRAAKQSVGSQAKQSQDTETNPLESKLKGKTGREFEREWRNLVDNSAL